MTQTIPAPPDAPVTMTDVNAAAAAGDNAAAATLLATFMATTPRVAPHMYLRLARLQGRVGRVGAALDTLDEGSSRFPDSCAMRAEQVRMKAHHACLARMPVIERRVLAKDLRALADERWTAAERMTLADALIQLGDIHAATGELRDVVARAETAPVLKLAFHRIPAVFERVEAVPLYEALLARSRAATWDRPGREWLELAILFALERRADFVATLDRTRDALTDVERFQMDAIARRWTTPLNVTLAEPRVICIGLPKTGTTTLAAAMRQLGFFHADSLSPITRRQVTTADLMFYDSVSDCDAAHDFERLYYLYPNARFIVTERAFDDWRRSLDDFAAFVMGASVSDSLKNGPLGGTRQLYGREMAMTYGSLLHTSDLRTAHERHARRVAHFFSDKSSDKLLRFNVSDGDGWAKLCAYLDRPIPEAPFPHKNPARPTLG